MSYQLIEDLQQKAVTVSQACRTLALSRSCYSAAAKRRSTQYASALHRGLLRKFGLVGSMSRKGNCWDIAVMERFFLNLKIERVWQKNFAKHQVAMTDVADYIVGFYNSTRLQFKPGYLLPNAFERKSATQPPFDVSKIT